MSWLRWLFGALGFGSLAWIVHNYGLDRLTQELLRSGWYLVPLVLTFVPTLFCYSLAWQLVTGAEASRPGHILRFFRFTAISIAWNNLSPFVKVLGEPVKVTLLEEITDRKNAIRSVVIYNIVHLIGTLGAFVVAALLIPFVYPVTDTVRLSCWLSVAVFTGIAGLLFWLPRLAHGFLRCRELRSLRHAALWVRWSLHKINVFFANRGATLVAAVSLEIAARFVEGLTFWVAFQIIQEPLSLVDSSFLEVGRALTDNAFFFVPYQVGSRELGISFFLQEVLGSHAGGFVAAAFLYRLVEIAWMAIGYMLWITRRKSAKSVT